MFLYFVRFKLYLISTILLISTAAFSSEKNITYMQILQDPNNLDLNLKYAQQQGKVGNFKQTISTLERLNMLYPDNVEINKIVDIRYNLNFTKLKNIKMKRY